MAHIEEPSNDTEGTGKSVTPAQTDIRQENVGTPVSTPSGNKTMTTLEELRRDFGHRVADPCYQMFDNLGLGHLCSGETLLSMLRGLDEKIKEQKRNQKST